MSDVVPRGWLSTALTVLLTLGVLAALGAVLLRLVPSINARWMFAALSFTPYALAGAGVLLLVSLATQRWMHCAAAALAVALLSAMVLPRALADAQPDASGQERTHQVDVLSLQELTPDAVAALDAAGLAALLPHRVFKPDARAAGTGVASRYPLQVRPSNPDSYHFQPVLGIEIPRAAEIELTAVHVVAPIGRTRPSEWRSELSAFPAATRGLPPESSPGTSTPPSTTNRCVPCSTPATATPRMPSAGGWRATWPTDTPVAPVVAIDHVLVDAGCAVHSCDVLPMPGSDHRAVIAEIVLPREQP